MSAGLTLAGAAAVATAAAAWADYGGARPRRQPESAA
jgi:hypothetical protein